MTATEKISKEIAEKQAGADVSAADLRAIQESFEKQGGREEDLISGSMSSFSTLKDVIVEHVMRKSSGPQIPIMVFAGTLQAHRAALASRILEEIGV